MERHLLNPELLEDFPHILTFFESCSKTGPEIFQETDGVLTEEDLSDEGNAFAKAYFDFERGIYLQDYEKLLCHSLPTMYHVADTWENYTILRERIDERFAQWKSGALESAEAQNDE